MGYSDQQFTSSGNGAPHIPTSDSQQQREPARLVRILSDEEREILQECSREALVYRVLPGLAVGIAGSYFAIAKGYLTQSARLGPYPKCIGFGILGALIGKISYTRQCENKFLLHNGLLGNTIRARRGLGLQQQVVSRESCETEEYSAGDVFKTVPDKPIFDDHKPDERDRNEGLEEYNKQVTESLSEYMLPADGGPVASSSPALSYDERRHQNREVYNMQQQQPGKRFWRQLGQEPSSPPAAAPAPASDGSSSSEAPSPLPKLRVGRKNQYGDMVYD